MYLLLSSKKKKSSENPWNEVNFEFGLNTGEIENVLHDFFEFTGNLDFCVHIRIERNPPVLLTVTTERDGLVLLGSAAHGRGGRGGRTQRQPDRLSQRRRLPRLSARHSRRGTLQCTFTNSQLCSTQSVALFLSLSALVPLFEVQQNTQAQRSYALQMWKH